MHRVPKSAGERQGRQIKSVLLMRVLTQAELHNTRGGPDQVRRAFPDSRLTALGAADSPATVLLSADRRFDDLLLMPPNMAQSARAFRAFMARQPCDATVMCFGATPGVNYLRQILASLLCPGRKFFLDAEGRLFPAASTAGIKVILRAGAAVFARALIRAAMWLIALALRLRLWLTPADKITDAGLPPLQAVRRLLFIRLDHIGDVAMSLPALHALRQRYPEAKIDALVLPGVAPILADVPDVDEVISYAAPVFTRGGTPAGLGETLALLRRLRRARYDVAVELRGNDLCRLVAFLAGASRRIGPARSLYESAGRPNYGFLLTHPVALADNPDHAAERSLRLLSACGLPRLDAPYRLPVTPERRDSVRGVLAALGVLRAYAVIHARPSEEAREWRPERFAAVADHLTQVHGLDVLLTGTGRDREYNAAIRAQVAHPERVSNAAGLRALTELPALFQGAVLMVSVDTGPMHLAALVGTPLVALFQPDLARLHHPYGQQDSVIVPPDAAQGSDHRIWDRDALTAISVAAVIEAVDRRLRERMGSVPFLRLVSCAADEELSKAA